jgi:hypothetical protein
MLSQLKLYALGALAIFVSVFGAMFAYRGKKIEALKEDVKAEKANVKQAEMVIERQHQVNVIQEKYHEIDVNIVKSSNTDKRDRLRKFNRS